MDNLQQQTPIMPNWQTAPMPPQKPKHTLRNIGLGCAGAAGLAVGVLLVVIVVAAVKGGGTTTVTSSTSGSAATSAPTSRPAGVGDTITIDGVSTTLNSVKAVQPGAYDEAPSKGNSYYELNVTMTNRSANVVTYNEFDFQTYNGSGASVDWPPILSTVPLNQQLSGGSLAPGGTVSGVLVAELPTDDTGAKLVWNPSFFDNSTTNAWNLGL